MKSRNINYYNRTYKNNKKILICKKLKYNKNFNKINHNLKNIKNKQKNKYKKQRNNKI